MASGEHAGGDPLVAMSKAKRTRHTNRRFASVLLIAALALSAASIWVALPHIGDVLSPQSATAQRLATIDNVNLRSGPGTDYDILDVLPAGTEVVVSGELVNGFYAVDVSDRDGWVSADFLSDFEHRIQAEEVAVTESVPVTEDVPPTQAAIGETEVAPIPTSEPTIAPTEIPVQAQSLQVEQEPQPGEHWIEVNRTTRTVTLHNGEIIVAQFDALIGKDLSPDGYYSTAVGTHYVHVKEKALVETPFAEGVYLTDFVGFDPQRSNGFHSPTRDAQGNIVVTGGTTTLGCVRLSEADAQFLFDFAFIGMRVEVHD